VRLVGAQSERTNAMAIALASGKPTEIPYLPTLADGLAGMADADMLAQAKAALDQIVVVTEDDVASAIAFLWIEEGLKVEGAGAVPVAAVMEGQVAKLEFPVAIVVSGGNIDDDKHRAVLDGKYNGS
jgi:threonine dehydratase